jgi:Tfp pilus assembly protein PilO
MPDSPQHWTEKYVTWQVFGLILTVLVVGLGWAFVAVAQINDRVEKHIAAQQQLNDAVVRLVTNQENMQKTLDKIASKLNVQ